MFAPIASQSGSDSYHAASAQDAAAEPDSAENADAEKPAAAADAEKIPEPKPPVVIPDRLRPYRILTTVAFETGPRTTDAFKRRVLADLASCVDRVYGQMWDPVFRENGSLFPTNRTGLARLSEADFVDDASLAEFDKVFTIAVAGSGPRYTLSGREWDLSQKHLGRLSSVETYDRGTVGPAAFDLVRRLFHPLIIVTDHDGRTVDAFLRAGGLPPSDPAVVQLKPGDLMEPYFRYLNRKLEVAKIGSMPWTYLYVESIERGRVKCTIVSGLRSPMGSRKTRRVEIMAAAVDSNSPATRLRVVPQNNPNRPLVAHSVTIDAKKSYRDESQGEPIRLFTDRQGEVVVPRNDAHPLNWLYVHSGEALLARVPYVPGSEPFAVIEVPDDTLRLRVEGEVELLESRLIDAVASRATVMIRAKSHAEKGDWAKADPLIEQFDSLPTAEQFNEQLNAIREPALQAANAQGLRATAGRIKKICSDAEELINRYLHPGKLRTAQEEIEEYRRISKKK